MDKIIELEVYSNGQWRDVRKANYVVRGTLPHLRAYCERWMARDKALDPSGMSEYHNFYIDPNERLTDAERDALGQDLEDFYRLINPWMFETCPHGMSAWLCEDPISHYPRGI